MKQYKQLIGYICIGLSIYFLMTQLNLPIFRYVDGIYTVIAIIGLSFVIYSQTKNEPIHLLFGTFFIGIGIHLFGLTHIKHWIDDWAMYLLFLSISILLYYLQTKKNGWIGLSLLILSSFLIIGNHFPETFSSIHFMLDFINTFWPIGLLIYGFLLLRK